MVLKRVTKQKANQGKSDTSGNAENTNSSFIARQTGGLCFDFNSKDSNTYAIE
jgi:hypothetical protein